MRGLGFKLLGFIGFSLSYSLLGGSWGVKVGLTMAVLLITLQVGSWLRMRPALGEGRVGEEELQELVTGLLGLRRG